MIFYSLPAQEMDFKNFVNRPENRPLVERHQRSEMKKAIKLSERLHVMEFRDKVREDNGRLNTFLFGWLIISADERDRVRGCTFRVICRCPKEFIGRRDPK